MATVVEGNQMDPFSIATITRCRGALLLSLNCSTLPAIRTLYCWVLNKEVSSTIFKVFGMTRPGIEPRSPGSLANTLPTGSSFIYIMNLALNNLQWLIYHKTKPSTSDLDFLFSSYSLYIIKSVKYARIHRI